jgi:hypothetical protein
LSVRRRRLCSNSGARLCAIAVDCSRPLRAPWGVGKASAIRASSGDARPFPVTSPPLYLRNRQLRMAPAGEPRGAAATAKDVAVTPRGADVMFAVFWTRRWKRAGVATDAAVGIRDSRSVHADAPVRDASPSGV